MISECNGSDFSELKWCFTIFTIWISGLGVIIKGLSWSAYGGAVVQGDPDLIPNLNRIWLEQCYPVY